MFRYIYAWRDLNSLCRPCCIRIPRRLLLRLYLGITLQAVLYAMLPTPFMLYTLPVGILILWQLAAWLRVWRTFRYAPQPPAIVFALVALLSLWLREDVHAALYRLYVLLRYAALK